MPVPRDYESRGTNIDCEDNPNYFRGRDMRKEKEPEITRRITYQPNRFEYFAALALQGLITGRSEKDIRKCVANALALAKEMEMAIDSQKDN